MRNAAIAAASTRRCMAWGVNGNVFGSTISDRVMALIRIQGPADPDIAAYHDLSDSELLRQRGLFVAEGRLVLQRVVEDRRFSLHSVLMNEANYRALSATLTMVSSDVPLF